MRAKFGKSVSNFEQDTAENFGRDLRSGKLSFGFDVDFQVESYLHYQEERLSLIHI